jgi:hypothetical protein
MTKKQIIEILKMHEAQCWLDVKKVNQLQRDCLAHGVEWRGESSIMSTTTRWALYLDLLRELGEECLTIEERDLLIIQKKLTK